MYFYCNIYFWFVFKFLALSKLFWKGNSHPWALHSTAVTVARFDHITNNGRRMEQWGSSLKTDLPVSHKEQFPYSLTFT